jgi:predicted GIY-YIG superfamily endonuclease
MILHEVAAMTTSRCVYILRSTPHPTRYYSGLTANIADRLSVHNSGGSLHTASLRPWELVAAIEFANPSSAVAFEKYLKSGSGRAFAKRHVV